MELGLPRAYCAYDFETTGLDTNTLEVTELAALKVMRRKGEPDVTERKSWLIKIDGPVPPEITEITGITKELLEREGVSAAQAFGEFVAFVGGLPLVGHNIARFDNLILERYCTMLGYTIPVGMYRYLDTAALYKGLRLNTQQEWYETHQEFAERILRMITPGLKYNLQVIRQEYGIELPEGESAHRAGADVYVCNEVYRRLAGSS